MSLEHAFEEILELNAEVNHLRSALKNIANRSKNSTATYFIWKVTQEALDPVTKEQLGK